MRIFPNIIQKARIATKNFKSFKYSSLIGSSHNYNADIYYEFLDEYFACERYDWYDNDSSTIKIINNLTKEFHIIK